MDKLFIIKIGGNIVDNEAVLNEFLVNFSEIKEKKILIHGGGKLATRLANDLKIEQKMVDGRRITDQATLEVVTMVYAGIINKSIVANLQSKRCSAIGLSGADGDSITSTKRISEIDYGFVGDVERVNTKFIFSLLDQGMTPVFSAITHDGKGQLLNTNADTIAQELATNLAQEYDATLIYTFEKSGVLRDVNDEGSLIPQINKAQYFQLKNENIIHSGMLPKLDNAFTALSKGLSSVVIGKAEDLPKLIIGKSGTTIII
jgi:acetylglutamate kinase